MDAFAKTTDEEKLIAFKADEDKLVKMCQRIEERFASLKPQLLPLPGRSFDGKDNQTEYPVVDIEDVNIFALEIENISQTNIVIDYCRLFSRDVSPLIEFRNNSQFASSDSKFLLCICPEISYIYSEEEKNVFIRQAKRLFCSLCRFFG